MFSHDGEWYGLQKGLPSQSILQKNFNYVIKKFYISYIFSDKFDDYIFYSYKRIIFLAKTPFSICKFALTAAKEKTEQNTFH